MFVLQNKEGVDLDLLKTCFDHACSLLKATIVVVNLLLNLHSSYVPQSGYK